MKRKGIVLGTVALFVLFFNLAHVANAAESVYPTKPIDMLVGLAAGGGTDLSIRALAELAKKSLGQELVVTNKPGGGGRVTTTAVAKAKPDGYTLGAITNSPIVLLPHTEKVSYSPLEDFTFIAQYGLMDFVYGVLADSPFKTFKDLIEFARKNPNQLTMGTSGVGTTNHVVMEVIANIEGIKVSLVPYGGAGPAVIALLGKHVMSVACGTASISPHVAAKTARILTTLGDKRAPAHPEVPTLKELGYPDLVFQSRYIIIGPKNMEKRVVEKLIDTFKKGVESPAYVKAIQDLELWDKNPLFGDELTNETVNTYRRYGEIFKKLKIGSVSK